MTNEKWTVHRILLIIKLNLLAASFNFWKVVVERWLLLIRINVFSSGLITIGCGQQINTVLAHYILVTYSEITSMSLVDFDEESNNISLAKRLIQISNKHFPYLVSFQNFLCLCIDFFL